MLDIYIFALFMEIYLLDKVFKQDSKPFIFLKYIVVFVIFWLLNLAIIPTEIGSYSALEMQFAAFGAPCILASMLSLWGILKIIIKDAGLSYKFGLKSIANYSINPLCFVLFALFGLILFLGNLDLFFFDIYHLDSFYQAIFIFIFIFGLFLLDKMIGIFALLGVILNLHADIFSAIFCVYLWLFSVIFIAVFYGRKLFARFK